MRQLRKQMNKLLFFFSLLFAAQPQTSISVEGDPAINEDALSFSTPTLRDSSHVNTNEKNLNVEEQRRIVFFLYS